jgi:hypothetical protein
MALQVGAEDFAILFTGGGDSGNNHSRYYNSLKGLYEVLVDQRGVAPENVIVLYADAGSGDQAFDQSLNQMDGFARTIDLLQQAGVDEVLLAELQSFWGKRTSSREISGLKQDQYERIVQLAEQINQFDVVHLQDQGGKGQDGTYFVQLDVLIRSDLSFARDRGTTVLSATPDALRGVLTDAESSSSLLNRVDENDHTFVWTFDHGGFDGPVIDGNWGDRAAGNRATLVPWKSPDIPAEQFADWTAPLLQRSGTSTLAFAQCFSGGLVEALEPQLASLADAYAMAATNAYEVSNAYGFAQGIELSLQRGNPLARDLFQEATAADDFAQKTVAYSPNGGDRVSGVEHPWAFPGEGGAFRVFSEDGALHPLENDGIAVLDSAAVQQTVGEPSIQLNLLEDGSINLQAALVGRIIPGESITGVTLPDQGRLELDPSGQLQYVPLEDVSGSDSLILQLEGPGGVRRLEVALNVKAVNDAPQATDDFVVVARGSAGTSFSVDPLTGWLGDFDLDADPLEVVDYSDPSHGKLEFVGGSSFVYTPDADFKGEDRFFYRLSDGAASSVAEVTIAVGGQALLARKEDGVYTLASVLMEDVFDPISRRNGRLLSDASSSRWDVVDAVRLEDRYALLLKGERKRRGQFRVWEAAPSGSVIEKGDWLSAAKLERGGYEQLFVRDFNRDGVIAAGHELQGNGAFDPASLFS